MASVVADNRRIEIEHGCGEQNRLTVIATLENAKLLRVSLVERYTVKSINDDRRVVELHSFDELDAVIEALQEVKTKSTQLIWEPILKHEGVL